MDTIKELSGSIRDYLRDRTSNPIYGAFIVAWVAINYRVLMVVFGDGTAREKIKVIEQQLYPSPYDGPWLGFAYPLILSVLFVLVSPFVRRWVTLFLRTREKETLTAILKIEGDTPLTKEQADALRQSLLAERGRRIKERDESNRQLDELRQQLDLAAAESLKKEVVGAPADAFSNPLVPADGDRLSLMESDFVGVAQKTQILASQRGISRAQGELLYVMRNGSSFANAEIAAALGFTELHPVKVLVDQMVGLGLIALMNTSRGLAYTITSAGTQALAAVMSRGFDAEASLARRTDS